MSRTPSWLCVFAWTCLLLLTSYYGARLPKQLIAGGIDVAPELIHQQHVMYAWIAIGLGIALIGLRLGRWSILTAIVSSLTYLVGWVLRGPIAVVGPVDGYKLMWHTAITLDSYIPFFVRHVLVPGSLVVALVGALLSLRRQRSSGPTIAV